MRPLPLLALGLLATGLILLPSTPVDAYYTTYPEGPNGILITVGLTIGHWFADLIPIPAISNLINAILWAWTPKPEDDYWEQVERQVNETCGEFINQDNIDKVLVYKNDVMDMLEIYARTPAETDGSYPDKNIQADAITTSIITNRYLIEGVIMPWSLTLYFVDIASIHLMILKDVAETYTFEGEAPSLWWGDLSREVEHYDLYSQELFAETVQFRKDNIECYFEADNKLDQYTVTDHVTGVVETCVQEHPSEGQEGSCASACQTFQDQVLRDFDHWYTTYVWSNVDEWRKVKATADDYYNQAQNFDESKVSRA